MLVCKTEKFLIIHFKLKINQFLVNMNTILRNYFSKQKKLVNGIYIFISLFTLWLKITRFSFLPLQSKTNSQPSTIVPQVQIQPTSDQKYSGKIIPESS